MRRLAKIIDENINAMGPLPDKVQRHHRISAVTAAVIATRLPLPSSPVENPKEWYIQNCIAPSEAVLAGLVEYISIDVEAILDISKKMWLNRYDILHNPLSPVAMKAFECYMSDMDKIAPVYTEAMNFDKSSVATQVVFQHIGNAMDESLPHGNTPVVE